MAFVENGKPYIWVVTRTTFFAENSSYSIVFTTDDLDFAEVYVKTYAGYSEVLEIHRAEVINPTTGS